MIETAILEAGVKPKIQCANTVLTIPLHWPKLINVQCYESNLEDQFVFDQFHNYKIKNSAVQVLP